MKTLKKGLTLVMLLVAVALGATAQDQETLLKAERIKSDQLPPEVVAAYKKKFPSANLKDIVKIPTKTYKKDWEIDELHKPTGDEQYYTLYLSGTGMNLEALYDKKGNLIRANEVAKNVALPRTITTYIVTNYKGYNITKDKVKRFIEPNKINADWEVTVAKGGDTKRLFFDKNGSFIKSK
ncbi:Putative beta-lactamase-inhibitor-like, PepSY-like [Chitinophaga jiangningensis]|uniref:Putative beta-lactamase-inhibitor-like, PepSY-like n=1 Tax=Chitinophaga jiangningensis TaxID=1419482 RepID=A0A1M7LX09_9BACT|nr:PepSY-like domain-containing protein [Chitinophaga jiangningensis]SHM82323.1 Putative beta-lactamase-inhibitor-like, PepSY-like [Chitinophaga jiangningensis]